MKTRLRTKNKFLAGYARYRGARITAEVIPEKKPNPDGGDPIPSNPIWYLIATGTQEEYNIIDKTFKGEVTCEPEVWQTHARKIESLRKKTYAEFDKKNAKTRGDTKSD